MMTVLNGSRYSLYREEKARGTRLIVYDLWLPILLFGSMGAITWAIRGSAGWGGVDGTVIPGMMWGLLWYYLCYRKGIDARGLVFWLGFGIALGGELGYGQYVSWIQGHFYAGNEILNISPWNGYVWFVLCGIGWAAPGGVLLGWALGERARPRIWFIRSLLVIILLILLFAWPFVDWLSQQIARSCPGLLFPAAKLGLYLGPLDSHLSRTVYTNTQNFTVVLWWISALIIAALQKDKTTLVIGLLIGGGFGLGFMQSALWCLGYGIAPHYIDWWKMWELNAGFNLGALYAVALYLATKKTDRLHSANGLLPVGYNTSEVRSKRNEWTETLFLAFGGSLLIFFMGFEYFFWTGLLLSILYFAATCLTNWRISTELDSNSLSNRRKNISLVYSTFLLVFLLFHGGSERAGILLGLYSDKAVQQYSWPAARVVLFAPLALLIVAIAMRKMWHVIRQKEIVENPEPKESLVAIRMVDLMTGIGFIGALSIWPSKIGVIYAFFIFLALFAFNRLNHRFELMESNDA